MTRCKFAPAWGNWTSFTVATPLVIEAFGSTSLVAIGSNYYLYTGGSGPELKNAGAPVVAGTTWVPIGAEQTDDVAWKLAGADQYGVWATDSNGNYTSTVLSPVSGSSTALESLETTFQQDLSGDGHVGIPPATQPAAVQAATGAADSGPSGPIIQNNITGQAATPANNAVIVAGHDVFVFAANFGQVSIANFTPATDAIEVSKTLFANVQSLFAATHDDTSGNAVITDAAHDTLTLKGVTTAQLLAHQNDFHFI